MNESNSEFPLGFAFLTPKCAKMNRKMGEKYHKVWISTHLGVRKLNKKILQRITDGWDTPPPPSCKEQRGEQLGPILPLPVGLLTRWSASPALT